MKFTLRFELRKKPSSPDVTQVAVVEKGASHRNWSDAEDAVAEVAEGLANAIEEFEKPE